MTNIQFWVNVYKSKSGNIFCFGNFKSFETASNSAKKFTYAGSTYLKSELVNLTLE